MLTSHFFIGVGGESDYHKIQIKHASSVERGQTGSDADKAITNMLVACLHSSLVWRTDLKDGACATSAREDRQLRRRAHRVLTKLLKSAKASEEDGVHC